MILAEKQREPSLVFRSEQSRVTGFGGCNNLTGADKDLCVALLSCMRTTGCWKNDPLDCLCGTAADSARRGARATSASAAR